MGLIMEVTSEYLSPEQVATLLDVKVGTLAAWRCRGEGPEFYRFGTLIRYQRKTIDEWAASRCVATAPKAALTQPNPLPSWLQNTRTKSQITGGSQP